MFIIGTPNTGNAGYMLNDNTASGGVREQSDVRTCTHCQAVILLHVRDAPYGYCAKCDAPVCARCAKRAQTDGCRPFKAIIDAAREESYRRRQLSRALGLE